MAIMMVVLQWVESSVLGHLMRDTGPWTYAAVSVVHLVGIAMLFGSVMVVNLRMLGFWRRVPLGALATIGTPLAGAGFALAVASGIGLLSAHAVQYATNPLMLVKFPAIIVAGLNTLVIQRSTAWQALPDRPLTEPEEQFLAILAAISLVSWFTAIAAGRLVGYW